MFGGLSIDNENVKLLGKINIINIAGNEATIDHINFKESQEITALIRKMIFQSKFQAAQALVSSDDAFAKLEKLSELHTKKIITDEEYQTKKYELLSSI